MTLDEAIKHCEDVAAKCFAERSARNHSGRCGFEYLDLAAWLRELKAYKEQEPCADAISRKTVWVKITNGAYPGESTEQFIDRISKEVETMPSVTPKQTWIPVSEELPEQGQEVICQCRANIIKVLKLDADFDWYQDADHCYMNGFVIAWMPLPEPYRQQESENET